jgi:hypothetical protein
MRRAHDRLRHLEHVLVEADEQRRHATRNATAAEPASDVRLRVIAVRVADHRDCELLREVELRLGRVLDRLLPVRLSVIASSCAVSPATSGSSAR